jgi:hypothetical protein
VEARPLLSGSVLVVLPKATKADKDVHGKLLFELQRMGVNPITYTLAELFPSAKASVEASKVAQRVGARSVVAMGGGAVCDAAKHVRGVLEAGGGNVPLLLVPTSFSPLPMSPSCGVLHFEEDVLVVAPAKPPSVVAMDGELLSKGASYHPVLTPLSLVVHLLDECFHEAVAQVQAAGGGGGDGYGALVGTVAGTVQGRDAALTPALAAMLITTSSSSSSGGGGVGTAELVAASVALGSSLGHGATADGVGAKAGVATTLATLVSTHSEMRGRAPFSWVLASVLEPLVSIAEEKRSEGLLQDRVSGDSDDMMHVALCCAVDSTAHILGIQGEALLEAAVGGRTAFKEALGPATDALDISDTDATNMIAALDTAYEGLPRASTAAAFDALLESSLLPELLERLSE